jgi:uncharacterized cysteine cluster protein YcgN (CxxCxxCC family)
VERQVNPRARVRTALARRGARWESLCRKCGLCCYEKERQGRTVVTNFRRPCRYLDISTRRCTVYDHRFEACPQCGRMTILHALFVPWLPAQCGYVQHFRRAAGPARRTIA